MNVGVRGNQPVLHPHDPVGEVDHALIVGDDDDRRAAGLGFVFEQLDDLAARFRVQRRGRLVGQHDVGLVNQSPGDSDPLTLAAGQPRRFVVNPVTQFQRTEHRLALLVHLAAGLPTGLQFQRHADVLKRGERSEKVVGLENKTQPPAQGRDVGGAVARARRPRCPQRHAKDIEATFLDPPQGADERQQRRFAAARGTGHDDDLATAERQTIVGEHLFARFPNAKVVLNSLDDDRIGRSGGGVGGRIGGHRDLVGPWGDRRALWACRAGGVWFTLMTDPYVCLADRFGRAEDPPTMSLSPIPIVASPAAWVVGWSLAAALMLGCDSRRVGNGAVAAVPPTSTSRQVVCQGVLQPATGLLAIHAPPGDRVAKIAVREGQQVDQGDVLLSLQSRTARDLEVQIAVTKLRQAEQQVQAQVAAGEATIRVAKLRMQQASQQLARAKSRLADAESPGGRLDVLRQAAELAGEKLQRLRSASSAGGPRIASDATLAEEQLRVTNAGLEYQAAVDAAEDAVQDAQRSLESAEAEITAAEAQLAATAAANPAEALGRGVELAQLQLNETEPVAPGPATVLEILTRPGAATTGMPLMRLADVSSMVVIAEVNAADLPLIGPGSTATVHSEAIAEPLEGVVTWVSPIIAAPALPSPVPTAPVDRFTGEVRIELANAATAGRLVGLQVEVRIDPVAPPAADAEP